MFSLVSLVFFVCWIVSRITQKLLNRVPQDLDRTGLSQEKTQLNIGADLENLGISSHFL